MLGIRLTLGLKRHWGCECRPCQPESNEFKDAKKPDKTPGLKSIESTPGGKKLKSQKHRDFDKAVRLNERTMGFGVSLTWSWTPDLPLPLGKWLSVTHYRGLQS